MFDPVITPAPPKPSREHTARWLFFTLTVIGILLALCA
jgi:hypothetical protein